MGYKIQITYLLGSWWICLAWLLIDLDLMWGIWYLWVPLTVLGFVDYLFFSRGRKSRREREMAYFNGLSIVEKCEYVVRHRAN